MSLLGGRTSGPGFGPRHIPVRSKPPIFAQADQFKAADPITQAKSQLAVTLCKVLRTLQQQLNEYRKQIEALFQSHPDHDLFGSLPGAKKVLADIINLLRIQGGR